MSIHMCSIDRTSFGQQLCDILLSGSILWLSLAVAGCLKVSWELLQSNLYILSLATNSLPAFQSRGIHTPHSKSLCCGPCIRCENGKGLTHWSKCQSHSGQLYVELWRVSKELATKVLQEAWKANQWRCFLCGCLLAAYCEWIGLQTQLLTCM